jgi:hypothetical protein
MYEDFMLENVEDIKEFISSKIAVGYFFNSIYGECLDGLVIKCQTFTIDEFQTWSKLIDTLLKENWSLLKVTMTRGEL